MSKPPKRPRDPNQLGKLIVDLSVGEVEEAPMEDGGKLPAAVEMGRKGGTARAAKMAPAPQQRLRGRPPQSGGRSSGCGLSRTIANVVEAAAPKAGRRRACNPREFAHST